MNAALAPVVLADDDLDDCSLTGEAFRQVALANPLRFVADGEKLLNYLQRCIESRELDPLPALILLDLNMPRMGGREALQAIKGNPALRRIPVVVWTTSAAEEDIRRAREAGCDAYLTKPPSFVEMVAAMRALRDRWLDTPDGAKKA